MKRLAAASGIASAVLWVVGIFLLVGESIDEDTNKEILSYYGDSGNRTGEIAGFMLVAIGVVLFLLFLSTLRSRLTSVEPEPRTLPTLGFGAGAAAAALVIGAAAVMAATSIVEEYSSRFVVDPNLARFAFGVGYLLLVGSVLVNCLLVAATSVLALRTEVLPTWLGWVGFAAVVLAIAEAFLLPVFVIPLWILVVSVVLLMRPRPAAGR